MGWRESVISYGEKLDTLNSQLARLIALWEKLTPGAAQYVPTVKPSEAAGLPLYNVRIFPLDTARTDEPINVPGDLLAAWTDGTLIGCTIKLDSASEDAIPLDKFNPITYTKGWETLYLTTTAQTDKKLYLFFGRAAGATTYPEITTSAERETFYTIKSDKDSHFSGALGQYAKENESLSGLITNKIRINGIAILSDQQLKYKVQLWRKDTFDNADLDEDTFIGEVDLDLGVYGWQVGGTGKYYMYVGDLKLDYLDEDNTNELHISLMNMSGTGKVAGTSGEVVVLITYSPRT